jgi:hypothetical protein
VRDLASSSSAPAPNDGIWSSGYLLDSKPASAAESTTSPQIAAEAEADGSSLQFLPWILLIASGGIILALFVWKARKAP